MMRADLTDITLVIDRSGSMASIRDDAEGGVNAFIAEQAQQPGECLVTIVQFDDVYELVQRGVKAEECPPFRLQPRGTTALLDSVGRAINETGARLAAMPESERPGLVVFVITTDGKENASKEFEREQVKAMIAHQQLKYSWQFTFLAANADAFAEAGGMGIDIAHGVRFGAGKVREANLATAKKVARMRRQNVQGHKVVNLFTEDERNSME